MNECNCCRAEMGNQMTEQQIKKSYNQSEERKKWYTYI